MSSERLVHILDEVPALEGLDALTMVVAFLAEIFVLPATIKLVPRLFSADAIRAAKARRSRAR